MHTCHVREALLCDWRIDKPPVDNPGHITESSLLYMQCLNVLNYFRSVERTLTINEEGLTVDGSHSDQKSSRTTRGLDHRHLFNTPADYM